MRTLDSAERERELRERLREFTNKLQQALELAREMERRAAAARREK